MAAVDSFQLFLRTLESDLSEVENHIMKIFSIIGVSYCAYKTVQLSLSLGSMLKVYTYRLLQRRGHFILRERDNENDQLRWAVIYGFQSGLSDAFAHQFAKHGFNLILVDSNSHRITVSGNALAESFTNIQVLTCKPEEISDGCALFTDKDIYVLVNNFRLNMMEPCLLNDRSFEDNSFPQNIQTILNLTQLILPQMTRRRCGAIINIVNDIWRRPSPMLTLYGAQQAWLHHLSRSLHHELQGTGVDAICLSLPLEYPALPGERVHSDAKVARHTLRVIGDTSITYGSVPYALQNWFWDSIPDNAYLWLFHRFCQSLLTQRV